MGNLQEAFCCALDVLWMPQVEQAHEFVAAPAAELVGLPAILAQSQPERAQEVVARRMAVRVVDVMEVVDIGEEHGKWLARPSVDLHRLIEADFHELPPGQACQRVARRRLVDGLDESLVVIRICQRHEERDELLDLPILIGQWHQRVAQQDVLAILAPHEHLERLGLACRIGDDGRAMRTDTAAVRERAAERHVHAALAPHLLRRETQELLRCRIPVQHRMVRPQHIAANWHGIHQRLQHPVALHETSCHALQHIHAPRFRWMCRYFFPRNIVHDIAFLRIRSQHRFTSFSSKRSFCLSISILLGIREIDNTLKNPTGQ